MAPRRVPTDGLLPIGRFAQATGLTVKALRHYAELGVLRPAHVDAGSGYRYYALAQLRTAAAIARLRALEVPLGRGGGAAWRPTRRRCGRGSGRTGSGSRRGCGRPAGCSTSWIVCIDGEEALVPETTLPELTVEAVPARTYVIRRDRVPMEALTQVIPRLIGETAGWAGEGGGGPAGAPMARVGPPDDDGVVDLEVGWPVAAGDARLGPPAAARAGHLRAHAGRRARARRPVRGAAPDLRRPRAGARGGAAEADRARARELRDESGGGARPAAVGDADRVAGRVAPAHGRPPARRAGRDRRSGGRGGHRPGRARTPAPAASSAGSIGSHTTAAASAAAGCAASTACWTARAAKRQGPQVGERRARRWCRPAAALKARRSGASEPARGAGLPGSVGRRELTGLASLAGRAADRWAGRRGTRSARPGGHLPTRAVGRGSPAIGAR